MLFFKTILIKGENKYYATWVLIFALAAIFAALDSSLVLFLPVKTAFVGLGISQGLSMFFSSVLILVYLIVIDYALAVFYPNSINEIISNVRLKADRMQWAIAILTFLFCVAQIVTTVGVSFYLRHTSASLAIAAPILVSVDSIVAQRTKADLKAVAALDESIESTRQSRATAVANSQRNKELQKLADGGNGWAAKTLASKAKEAAAKYDREIGKIVSTKTTLLSQNAMNVATVAQSSKDDNTFLKDQYTQRTNSIATFLMWFSILATAFQCFAGLMIALFRSAYNYGNYERMAGSTRPVSTTDTSVSTTTAAADAVSTTDTSVSTDAPKAVKSVSTDEKTVSTAKTVEKEAEKVEPVSTDSDETVKLAFKAKIQLVNQECSNYQKKDGTQNGDGDTIAGRLAKSMLDVSKFLNDNPKAATPEIIELYNKALERGKGTLGEHKERKTKTPTLFDTVKDKEVAHV